MSRSSLRRLATSFSSFGVLFVSVASFALAPRPALAQVTLQGSDPSGTSSFNSANFSGTTQGWNNDQAPSSGNTYSVSNTSTAGFNNAIALRTPATSGNQTWAGGALTLGNNGDLKYKGAGGGTDVITISNLIMDGGFVENGQGGSFTLAGGITLSSTVTAQGSAGGTFETNGGNRAIIASANISGAGTLTADNDNQSAGTGLVILSGTNSYGATVISDTSTSIMTLQIGNGGSTGSLGTGTVTTNANTTLAFDLTSNYSFGQAISGGGALTLMAGNTGAITLTGGNTYTGGTTLGGGTLSFVNGALGSSGNVTFTGGTLLYASGNMQNLGARIKNSTSAVAINTNGNTIFSSAIDSSNSGGLTKSGAGVLYAGAANAYSGPTVVNGGTLRLGAYIVPVADTSESYYAGDDRAPIHAIDGSGMSAAGSPLATAGNSPGGSMWLSNGDTNTWITFDLGSVQTVTGFHLWNYNESSNANYSRGVKTAGVYYGNSLLAQGSSYASGGTAWGTLAQNFTFSEANGSTTYAGSDYSFTTPVTTRYLQIYVGSNFGGDAYTGISEIGFYGAGNLPSASPVQLSSGANLDLAGNSQTIASLADGTAGGGAVINSASGTPVTLTISAPSGSTSFSGTISDSGSAYAISLLKSGASTQVLGNRNTYSGSTTISGGTVVLQVTAPPAGAAARYTFNGSNANDSAGSNNGTLIGSPTFVNGISGKGINFNGAGQYVSVPYGSGALAFNTAGYTVSFWENLNATVNGSTFISTRNGGDNTFDLQLKSGGLHADYGSGSAWINTSADANATLNVGVWNMITYTVSTTGAADTYTAYLNGTQIGTGTTTTTLSPAFMTSAETLTIGSSNMNAIMDEVNLYGTPLTPAQVNQLYVNTFAGNTNVLPASTPVTINSGSTLDLSGTTQTILSLADFTPGNGGTVTNSVASPVTLTLAATTGSTTFTGVITDGGLSNALTLTKTGAGTQILAGANTYHGATNILGGELRVAASGSISASSAVSAGGSTASGTPTLSGAGMVSGAVTVNGASGGAAGHLAPGLNTSGNSGAIGTLSVGSLTLNSGAALDYDFGTPGVIGAPGQSDLTAITNSLTLPTSGAVTLNLFDNAGVNGLGSLGNGTYKLFSFGSVNNFSNTIFTIGASALTGRSYSFSTTGTELDVTIATEAWTGGASTGAWQTAGNWVANAIPGSTSSTTNTDTATFNSAGNGQLNITPDANRNVQFLVFDTAAAGAYVVGTTGGSPLLLTNNGGIQTTGTVISTETVNEPITIEGAAATFTSGSTSAPLKIGGNITGSISGGGTTTLTINGANGGLNTISGVISDNGTTHLALVKSGAGTWILNNAEIYTAGTTISNGTLQLGDGTNNGSVAGNILNNSVLAFSNGSSQTFSGVISGSGAVNVNGPATLNLTGANTYSGGTTIGGATLNINADAALGTAPATAATNLTFATSGTLQAGASGAVLYSTRNISIASGAVATIDTQTNPMTINGAISGGGSLVKIGSGTLMLGSQSTYTGATTINAGTLRLAAISAPATTVAFTTDANSGIGTASQYGSAGYTHALAFNGSGLTINGLAFTNASQSGTGYSTFNWGSMTNGSFSGAGTNTNILFDNLLYGPGGNGSVQTLTITGLTPGSSYDARVYYRDWDGVGGGPRAANWTADPGTGVTTTLNGVDQDANGTGNYLDFRYQVGASGTLTLSATDLNANSWHLYGFTNQLISSIAGSNILPTTTPLQISSGATLDLNAVSQTVASLAGPSGGTVTDSSAIAATLTIAPASGSTIYSGVIQNGTGTVSLQMFGATGAVESLAGANTYTGGTTLAGGTLSLGSSGAIGSTGTITFTGGTLQFTAANPNTSDYSSRFSTAAIQAFIIDTNGQNVTFGTGMASSGGTFTKVGAGTLTSIAANTYTGATMISAGTLQLGDGTSGHDASLATTNITDNSALVYNVFSNQSGAYSIIGTGRLTKLGGGTLTLSGAGSYSGGTTVNNGIINFANSSLGTGPITFTGGSLQFATGNTQELPVIKNSTSVVSIDTNGNTGASLAVDSTNTAGFIKNGAGALVMLGGSSYSGSTTINGGTLRLGAATSAFTIVNPGFETPVFGAGAWAYGPTGAGIGWTFPATYTGIANNGSPWVNTAPQGVQAAFVQSTAGNPQSTISQSISIGATGNYDINFEAANRPGYSSSNLALQIDGVTVGSWAAATINDGAVFQNFSLLGIPLTAGPHTLAFTGTLPGGTDSATAIDNVTTGGYAAGALPATTALAISSGGTFDVNGNSQTVASLTGVSGSQVLLTGSGALTTGGDNTDSTFAGTIAGSGMLTKTGGGTLTLTGANTYTGATVVNGGTLRLGDGTSGHDGSLTTSGITNSAALTCYIFGNQSVSYPITGGGTLLKQGAGTLTISGSGMGFTGATTISGGRLQLEGASAASPATSSITVNPGATLGFTAGAASTMNLGSGAMTLAGGTVNFDIGSTGVNDAINVNSLTLTNNSFFTFNAIGAIDSTSTYTLLTSTNPISAGSYTIAGQTVGRLTLDPVINANSITLTPILQQGVWNIPTGGNWSASGNWLNYTPSVAGDAALFGPALAASDIINLDVPESVGFITFNNATASYTIASNDNSSLTLDTGVASPAVISVNNGSHTIAANVALNSSVTIAPATGAALTISGAVSGAGGIQIVGSGTVTLSGANSQNGGVTLNSSQLNINNATALGATAGTFVINGGTIDNTSGLAVVNANNNPQTWGADINFLGSASLDLGAGAVTLTGSRTVTVGGNVLAIDGAIGDGASTFGLTKAGVGTLTLAGANTYKGGTTLNAGQLNINNPTALGSGAGGQVTNSQSGGAAILTVTPSTITTFSGSIHDGNGPTALTVNGTGTGAMVLAGANTYSGATTVRGGVLAVTGSLSATSFIDTSGPSGAELLVAGGTVTTTGNDRIGLAQAGNTTATGTVYLTAGSISASQDSNVGFNAVTGGSATGFVYQTGGSYTQAAGAFYIGVLIASGSATGTYNMSGGTLGTGTLFLGGGGSVAGANSTLNVNGGVVTAGTFNSGNANVATVNLGGGTLVTPGWATGATNSTLNFSGGTLRAGAASAAFLGTANAVNLYTGGGTIDTQANNITITQMLQNPAGNGLTSVGATDDADVFAAPTTVSGTGGTGGGGAGYTVLDANGHVTGVVITSPGSYSVAPTGIVITGANPSNVSSPSIAASPNGNGGLTIIGAGSLTLTAASTYTGNTTLNGGTLRVANSTGSATGYGNVTLTSGTLASGVAGTGGNGSIAGAVTAGTGANAIAPGGIGTLGTLTLGSTLGLNSNSTLSFDINGASSDLLAITGAISVTGGPVVLNLSAVNTTQNNYTLATFATSALSAGNFTVSGMPAGYNLIVQPNDILISTGPPLASGTWTNGFGDYKWTTQNNWTTGQPIGVGYIATFDNTGLAATTAAVQLNGGITAGGLVFNTSGGGYTIGLGGADGTLTLDNTGVGPASISDNAGTQIIAAPIALNSNLTISVANAADSLTLSGAVSGTNRTLTKTGAGTLTLSAANSYSGGTTVSAGTLRTTVDNALGSGSLTANAPVILGGSESIGSLSGSSGGSVSVAAGKTLAVNQTSGGALAGSLTLGTTGAGANLSQTGTSSLTLSGVTTINQGSTIAEIGSGALQLNVASGSSIGSGVMVAVGGSATLQLAGMNSALADPSMAATERAAIVNTSTAAAGIDVLPGAMQQVGGIDGDGTNPPGNVVLEDNSSLTADHINQTSLVIGSGATFTIAPSAADGSPMAGLGSTGGLVLAGSLTPASSFVATSGSLLGASGGTIAAPSVSLGGVASGAVNAVPEPSTILSLAAGCLALMLCGWRRQSNKLHRSKS